MIRRKQRKFAILVALESLIFLSILYFISILYCCFNIKQQYEQNLTNFNCISGYFSLTCLTTSKTPYSDTHQEKKYYRKFEDVLEKSEFLFLLKIYDLCYCYQLVPRNKKCKVLEIFHDLNHSDWNDHMY